VLRAVLDANVYVSAAIRPEGPPGLLIRRFLRASAFEIVLSPAIAAEVLQPQAYPTVPKLIRGDLDATIWFEDILVLADLVADAPGVSGVCVDPDHDKYVAAALEGRGGFIVTGDRQLLALGQRENVRVVPPRAFLDILER
jgi:putative PIN family toxin of toxin-antitoxin system